MRTRYTIDADSGLLIDRDGNALGRVVGITIESVVGEGGSSTSLPSTNDLGKEETASKDGGAGETKTDAVQRVWDYYCETITDRRRFDEKRKRFIRNALKMFTEDQVKLAILGLSRSPWHNGENQDRKKYLDLHYALRGKGDESDDDRIEKAMTWAAIYAPDAPSMPEPKVARLLEEIRYTCSLEHQPERDRAVRAWRELNAAGFTVVRLDKSPWARLER